jgi:hypothetical protein
LLAGLTDLLKKFEPKVRRPSRTEKETDNTRTNGKGKGGTVPRLASDVGLLNALQRLVTRAEKKPEGLLGRLKNLLNAAENAAKSGQSMNPGSTKTTVPNQTERDSSKEVPKGTSKGKTKGKTGAEQDKPTQESPCITVGRGGRPVGKEKGKGNKGIRPVVFRLREQDRANTVVVQSAGMFGSMVDKKGAEAPFVVMVMNPDELKVVLGIIHGDKNIRVSVLCPYGFPEVKFVYDKLPLWDSSGKLVTKNVASWNNLTQKVKRSFQVGVPVANDLRVIVLTAWF